MARLDTDEVLPAHRHRFGDLAQRVDEITRHHHRPLGGHRGESSPRRVTLWQIAARLTWNRPWDQYPLALRLLGRQRDGCSPALPHPRDRAVRFEGCAPVHLQPPGVVASDDRTRCRAGTYDRNAADEGRLGESWMSDQQQLERAIAAQEASAAPCPTTWWTSPSGALQRQLAIARCRRPAAPPGDGVVRRRQRVHGNVGTHGRRAGRRDDERHLGTAGCSRHQARRPDRQAHR